MDIDYIVVLVTAKDLPEAEAISQGLLHARAAACVNILQGAQSFFWWEGKVDRALEVLLVIKTRKKLFEEVVRVVKSLHSYTVPEIIALPIIAGSADYLEWMRNSVQREK